MGDAKLGAWSLELWSLGSLELGWGTEPAQGIEALVYDFYTLL